MAQITQILLSECPITEPILVNGNCEMKNCSKEEFDSKSCIINNTIIKIQWLNNIIMIGGLSYRYINFGTYSNGDMVVETTCYPAKSQRYFYGLKKNGRPFFTNKTTQDETPYNLIETKEFSYSGGLYEAESIIIKSSEDGDGNGKEYFLNIGKLDCSVELYDLEKNTFYYKSLKKFTTYEYIKTFRHTIFSFPAGNNKYLYFIGFTSDKNYWWDVNVTVHFQKHIFNSINDFENTESVYDSAPILLKGCGTIMSSFLTEKGLIIVFFLTKSDNNIYYNIRKYEADFSNPVEFKFQSYIDNDKIFFKCIHLKEEVGIFVYYKSIDNIQTLCMAFREFNITNNTFVNYLSDEHSEILLNKKVFNVDALLSDMIKLNEDKICLFTLLENKETAYIILVDIFGVKQIKIRYYYIPIFGLYNFKILYELRIHNYNNFMAFASSNCPNKKCESDRDEHYSNLIIFNYPNSTDTEFNIEEYIIKNNTNIHFNEVEIDLKTNLIFENNVFGYILSNVGIEDIIDCDDYKLYSSKDETKEINANTILDLDENFKIKYIGNDKVYRVLNCKIQYYFIATEPDLSIYDIYPEKKQGDEDNEALFKKEKYYGRLTNFIIISNHELSTECKNNTCDLCLNEQKDYCLTCKYKYSFMADGTKICFDLSNNKCTSTDIIKNKCTNITLNPIQISELDSIIRGEYLSNNTKYNGKNNIIQTENVLFQVTSLDNQSNSDFRELSIIDLGKCKEKLKAHYNIPETESLIIYKTDIKTSNSIQTYVQYEIYNPLNLERLNLTFCEDSKVTISSNVHLDNSTISLYNSLFDSGYNLFDEKDPFYSDICCTYTSQNGTDMTLVDRKKEILDIKGNISLCQENCELSFFNSTTQDIKCVCYPQINKIETDFSYSDKKFPFELIRDNFFNSIKNSNFLVLKCYKLAFDISSLLINFGRIIMTIIVIISFAFLFVFLFYDYKRIDSFLITILNSKMKNKTNLSDNKLLKTKKKEYKKKNLHKNNNKIKRSYLTDNNQTIIEKSAPPKKNVTNSNITINSKLNNLDLKENDSSSKNFVNDFSDKKKDNENNNKKVKNNTNINIIKIKNFHIKKYVSKKKKLKKDESLNDTKNKKINNNDIISSKFIIYEKGNKNSQILNDQELNSLDYEKALEMDNRSFGQYYASIIKRNQLILFTFCSNKDYNLLSIKICLFLTHFSLYLTMNCFFFGDKTMHQIYLDNGAYRFLFQLPQIIYTSVLTLTVNTILKHLSLSDGIFMRLKRQKIINKAKCKKIKGCLKIKFSIFFILNYLLLLFLWYYISCFSGVFKNTQNILFSDTLISFFLSLLYPFGYNLFPAFFRISALRAEKKDKNCLYSFGRLLSFH